METKVSEYFKGTPVYMKKMTILLQSFISWYSRFSSSVFYHLQRKHRRWENSNEACFIPIGPLDLNRHHPMKGTMMGFRLHWIRVTQYGRPWVNPSHGDPHMKSPYILLAVYGCMDMSCYVIFYHIIPNPQWYHWNPKSPAKKRLPYVISPQYWYDFWQSLDCPNKATLSYNPGNRCYVV